jgi:hypothetical protein
MKHYEATKATEAKERVQFTLCGEIFNYSFPLPAISLLSLQKMTEGDLSGINDFFRILLGDEYDKFQDNLMTNRVSIEILTEILKDVVEGSTQVPLAQ